MNAPEALSQEDNPCLVWVRMGFGVQETVAALGLIPSACLSSGTTRGNFLPREGQMGPLLRSPMNVQF